ncbi:MAG: family 43 glycosylhydrolase [Atopobiaceae bacterium]|nr:family 43 glycosylhydrolase [Atopobiaceae bacterium]
MTYMSIRPGKVWLDTSGAPIQAHGAGMYRDGELWYWYGENKERTTGRNRIWTWGIRCYSSKDLCNWEDKGLIIPPGLNDKESSLNPAMPVDRPHIIRNSRTGRYVCWLKLSGKQGYFVVLESERLCGPYRIVRDHMKPYGCDAGDFDIWQDAAGNGFIMFEHDHAGVIAAELSADFLSVKASHREMFAGLKPPLTREGITHFMHDGKHYLLTSGMTGYIPNPSEAAVADDPLGPYEVIGNPFAGDDDSPSFNSQVSCVVASPHPSGSLFIMADRWVPGYQVDAKRYQSIYRVVSRYSGNKESKPNLRDYLTVAGAPFLGSANTSIARYVWLPLEFDEDAPRIRWRDEWSPREFGFI